MAIGDKQMMISRVQAWIKPQMMDAEESRRSWHLKCIQAEAELRALQGKAPISPGRGPTSPIVEVEPFSIDDVYSSVGLRPLSPKESASPEAPLSARGPEDVPLQTLAKALALEQHLLELESLRLYIDQEMLAVRQRCDSLETRLSDEKDATNSFGAEARAVRDQARDLVEKHASEHSEHEERCKELVSESRQIAQDANFAESVDKELADAEVEKEELIVVVGALEDEYGIMQQKRETLWMSREDARTWLGVYNHLHTQTVRETAAAKRTLQAKSTELTRFQGQAQRSRTQSERKRRQIEGQLRQCRGELADAVARADVAGEQLRKVQQQHGKELRGLRSKTEGLQFEVDEHLNRMLSSEADIEALHNEEAQMGSDRERLELAEQRLEVEAVDLRLEAQRLESQVSSEESACFLTKGRLRDAEVAYTETKRKNMMLSEEAEKIDLVIKERDAECDACRAEVNEELQKCSSQTAEVRNLEVLQANVSQLRTRKAELATEHSQLQETVKQALRGNEKHLADMQEATRRASRVKAQHADLQNQAPSGTKGREALIASVDQAMGRVTKKVDLLTSCLETMMSAPSKTPRGENSESAALRGQAALQKRLLDDWEKDMEHRLAEERRKVVVEQQRSLDTAKLRATELQKARQERRRLEEELGRARDALEWARRSTDSELEGLRAQVRLVEHEATEEAETVTAEFSDLLQKEALERDDLQAQVDQLRKDVEKAPASPEKQSSAPALAGSASTSTLKDGDPSSSSAAAGSPKASAHEQAAPAVQEEAASLQAEEAELLHAHVQLKAALIAKRQRLQERARAGGRPSLDTATRRHGSSASRGGSRGSSKSAGDAFGAPGPRSSSTSSPLKDLMSREALTINPATPMSASRRSESRRTSAGGGGSQSPTTTIVTMEDTREDATAVNVSDSLASPSPALLQSPPAFPQSPQLSNHHRTVSTRTVSTSGSSANLNLQVIQPTLGQQLSASTRSISSHSVSTSASAMPPGSFGAAASSQTAAAATGSFSPAAPTPALQRHSKGAVYTWPAAGTAQSTPTQQDRKDTIDPRALATLG
mmetsp:Transcript_70910/g.122898  ORF Transcript_70910/g.122898 Transcript_70910/m.122898 type:complete len:1063 (-) Transcript_70910:145-3333(-)